jgi:mRNA interferase RelE/StbE
VVCAEEQPAWAEIVRRAERGEPVPVIAHGDHVADIVPCGEPGRLRETMEVLSGTELVRDLPGGPGRRPGGAGVPRRTGRCRPGRAPRHWPGTGTARYAFTFTPAARRRPGVLPLPAAGTLYEHLTGPVAANPHRLGKPLDAPFEEVLSTRRGDYRALSTVDDRDPGGHPVARSCHEA